MNDNGDDPLAGIDWQAVAHEIWLGETEKRLAAAANHALAVILLSNTMPTEHLEAFLQTLRTFDVEHGTDAAIAVLNVNADLIKGIFERIQPPFPFREEWKDREPN